MKTCLTSMGRLLSLISVAMFALITGASASGAEADLLANESVSLAAVEKAALKDILLGKTAYWEGGQAVVIVIVDDKVDAQLQEITGMSSSQFKTHWQRLAFSGRGQMPKSFAEPEKAVAHVAATKGAIVLVPPGTSATGVKKIPQK